MIPDEVIDEVRTRADIVEIIGEMVPLKKSGREYKANCPFHDERTPSFYVVPDKGFYKCFGCGKSGSVFDFVMERQGMDFVEAVKYVAGRAGVEVREVRVAREEEDPNRPYFEANAMAQLWYREQLMDEQVGAKARAYLHNRGITDEVAERFGLGFAPDEWRAFREAALKHGLNEDVLLELGLLRESEKSKEPYDGFRGRVMVPIHDLARKVVGFGGRLIEDDGSGGKYINSTDSVIYRKGQMLYGLGFARHAIKREEAAVLVEGYMDVISLAAAGFENVVAVLGTSVTPEQAALLKRYCTRVFLLFDSDSAGLKATFRTGDILLEAGLHPSVATMPPGEDPDSLVQTRGADSLRALLGDAVDVLDRKLQILDERDYFSSIDRTLAALDRLLPTIRAAKDPAVRDIYVSRVAERTGVRRETIEDGLAMAEKDRARSSRPGASGSSIRDVPTGPPKPVVQPRGTRRGAELQLLKVMVRGVEWVERAAELISPEDFEDPYHRAIFQALLDDPELRAPPTAMDLVAAQRFDEILTDPEELAHGIEIFTNSVTRIRVSVLDRRLQDLQQRSEAASTDEEKTELIREKSKLAAELRELDPNYWVSATRRGPGNRNPNEVNR